MNYPTRFDAALALTSRVLLGISLAGLVFTLCWCACALLEACQ